MDNLTLEDRRCERLRNKLTSHYLLVDSILNGNLDHIEIIKLAERAEENQIMIDKALNPKATLEDLEKLY